MCSVKRAFTTTIVESLRGYGLYYTRGNAAWQVRSLGTRYSHYARLEILQKGVLSGLRHPGFLSYQWLDCQCTCHRDQNQYWGVTQWHRWSLQLCACIHLIGTRLVDNCDPNLLSVWFGSLCALIKICSHIFGLGLLMGDCVHCLTIMVLWIISSCLHCSYHSLLVVSKVEL